MLQGAAIATACAICLSVGLGCKKPDRPRSTTDQPATESNAGQSETRGQEDHAALGFDLIEKEAIGFLRCGLDDSEVLRALGEAEEKSESVVWGADGLEHQTWCYKSKGIELDMVRDEDHQTVNQVKVSAPCKLKTARSIGIGSPRTDVLKAYGNEINEEDSSPDALVAGSVYGGVIFGIEDGRVSSIFIGAAAE